MFKRFVLLSILLSLSACAADDDQIKLEFPDNTTKSLVLIRAGAARISYTVRFTRFDEAHGYLDATVFGGGDHEFTVETPVEAGYYEMVIDPGTYIFQGLAQQSYWGVCFNQESRSFTVQPGEAVFLGELDASVHLAQLERLVKSNGNLVHKPYDDAFYYFDGIIPPQISSPTETSTDFRQAKAWEMQSLPALHGRLKPVTYKSAKFGTGYTFDGQRICGGSFKEKATPRVPQKR